MDQQEILLEMADPVGQEEELEMHRVGPHPPRAGGSGNTPPVSPATRYIMEAFQVPGANTWYNTWWQSAGAVGGPRWW